MILLERYACLGGMATGGQVLLIPFLSDPVLGDGREQLISGLVNEWIDRLRAKPHGVFGPEKNEIGSTDEKIKDKYRGHGAFVRNRRVQYGMNCDPEMLKVVLNEMAEDAGIIVYCHCLACRAITEDGKVKGVIFESKEGRQAILAGITLDCTGDGDVFASAGAEFETSSFTTSRTANTALVFRLGGVSYSEYVRGMMEPEKHMMEKMDRAMKIAGFKFQPFSSNRDDVIWFNNWIPRNCMDLRELTDTSFTVTRHINELIEYLRANFPGMQNACLYDFASQIGTRGSRRLKGEYRLTMDDIAKRSDRDDIIAVLSTLGGKEEYPRKDIPYGILVPQKLDGLLAAGSCFPSDEEANQAANWIPHCIALGEAAGTAAALSLSQGMQPRNVDRKSLRSTLRSNGVYLLSRQRKLKNLTVAQKSFII